MFDRAQRVADVVGDAGRQPAQGRQLDLLGLLEERPLVAQKEQGGPLAILAQAQVTDGEVAVADPQGGVRGEVPGVR